MDVITDARWRRERALAAEGDLAGLRQLFRDAADPAQVGLLRAALRLIGQVDQDSQRLALSGTRPGFSYTGRPEARGASVVLLRQEDDLLLATAPASLRQAREQPGGQVRFTAQGPDPSLED